MFDLACCMLNLNLPTSIFIAQELLEADHHVLSLQSFLKNLLAPLLPELYELTG